MKYIAGIDLGGTYIKAALMDESFTIVARAQVPTPYRQSPEVTFERIFEVVDELLLGVNADKSALRGIGIGIPGLTDYRTSIAHEVPFLKWRNIDVAKPIREHYGVPAFAENDGAVNALGEYYFGAGRGQKNIILLTLGTGLGSGIIIDGKLLRGENYVAAETGHMVIETGGDLCACGKRGCFESCCSGKALIRYAQRFALEYPDTVLLKYTNNDIFALDGKMIDDGYDIGDEACVKAIGLFVQKLSVGLVNLIDLFNPGMIIIGGGVSRSGDRILAPVRELVRQSLMHPIQECSIVAGKLYTDAGVMGACAMAAESIGAKIPV
ncbi:MAG: ROK family protein [Burkholderiales bacterium]|jgi:glucokinase